MVTDTNLKVLIYDHDLFALHAINSYLAWDRRTRVHCLVTNVENAFEWLANEDESEWPDVLLLDTFQFYDPTKLTAIIQRFYAVARQFGIVILDHEPDSERLQVAVETRCKGYFLRADTGIHIASSLVWLQNEQFGVSISVERALKDTLPQYATVLPDRRQYPELTDRIRQAIQLCVVEGMSADLAADEMGVSTHTIRSYIKEGYRILEAYDDNKEYPIELSAQERAFIRYTSLQEDDDDLPLLEEE
jgi:DNA-binding NarL/FixJ family response regulator